MHAPVTSASPIQRVRTKFPVTKKKKYRKKYGISTTLKSGRIETVNITGRPSFSSSTKKQLAKKYSTFHRNPRGLLIPGYSRNHIVAWAVLKPLLAEMVRGLAPIAAPKKIEEVMKTLKINYSPGKAVPLEAQLKRAGKALFNNFDNLRVGDSSANSSAGSKMNHEFDGFNKAYLAATSKTKPTIYHRSKKIISRHAIDRSPTSKRVMESIYDKLVKLAMNRRIERSGLDTPPSAEDSRFASPHGSRTAGVDPAALEKALKKYKTAIARAQTKQKAARKRWQK